MKRLTTDDDKLQMYKSFESLGNVIKCNHGDMILIHTQDVKQSVKLPDMFDIIYSIYDVDIEYLFESTLKIEEIFQESCEKLRVFGYDITSDGIFVKLGDGDIFNQCKYIHISEFNKTLFLSKEDVMEELKKRKLEEYDASQFK